MINIARLDTTRGEMGIASQITELTIFATRFSNHKRRTVTSCCHPTLWAAFLLNVMSGR